MKFKLYAECEVKDKESALEWKIKKWWMQVQNTREGMGVSMFLCGQ